MLDTERSTIALCRDNFRIILPRHMKLLGIFYAPVTIVRKHYVLSLSVCLSVRPSVRPSCLYKVCVINSSQSFQGIILKLCTYIIRYIYISYHSISLKMLGVSSLTYNKNF